MREPSDREIQKEAVLKNCFDCLVETGMESITTRDFTRVTGLKPSSLYYWFDSKDEIIYDATNYGINYVVDSMFKYVMHNIDNIQKFSEEFPEFVQDYKAQLKTIIQVTTSRKYSARIKETFSYTEGLYDICAEKIFSLLEIEYKEAKVLVDLFVSTAIDYVIWDKEDKFKEEIAFIFSFLENTRSCK